MSADQQKKGWRLEFSQNQGGKPEHALKHHLLHACIRMAINKSSEAVVSFVLPPEPPYLLGDQDLPPMELTIRDSKQIIFQGFAASLQFSKNGRSRRVSVTYRDPIFWQLGDVSYYTYPSGNLKQVIQHLTADRPLGFTVDSSLTNLIPASYGSHGSALDIICGLSREQGALLFYNPAASQVEVKHWGNASSKELPADCFVCTKERSLDGYLALKTMQVKGRKQLTKEWYSEQVKGQDVASSGDTTKKLEAWQAAATNQLTLHTHSLVANTQAAAARKLASQKLHVERLQAANHTIEVREATILAGEVVEYTDPLEAAPQKMLVTAAESVFASAVPYSVLQGVII